MYVHYMQSDEWTISISSRNRCENFTEPGMDVPRNKGNYAARASRMENRSSQVSRSFLIFRNGIYYGCSPLARARAASEIRNTSPSSPSSLAKKYSRSKFRFSLLRKHGKSIFMRHRKSDITLRRRNVSRSRSIHFFRILYSRLFTILVWPGRPLFLRLKFQQL